MIPRGSYPTPLLGYLVLWSRSGDRKIFSYPRKGLGNEPTGRVICNVTHTCVRVLITLFTKSHDPPSKRKHARRWTLRSLQCVLSFTDVRLAMLSSKPLLGGIRTV